MAKSQEDITTILLGIKGYEVEEVIEEERGIVVRVRTRSTSVNCPGVFGEVIPAWLWKKKGSASHLEQRQEGLP